MLNSIPFTNFINSKSTITRKLSTNIQLGQRDLSARSKGKGTNLFNLQTKYRKNYTNFYSLQKKKKILEETLYENLIYTILQQTMLKTMGRKKIYSKSFLNIVQTSIILKIYHINSSTAQCLSETKAKSNFFFFQCNHMNFSPQCKEILSVINPVNLLGHSAKRKLSEVVGQQGG